MPDIVNKTKLTFKDMGKPEAVKDEASGVLHMARVYGVANDIINRNMPNGDKFQGLKGSFRAVRNDGSGVNAPVCYFPEALHSVVASKLTDKASVAFCFDIASQKTDGEPGWSLKVDQVMAPEVSDPIANLVADIEGDAPEVAQADPAPAAADKGKGKAAK